MICHEFKEIQEVRHLLDFKKIYIIISRYYHVLASIIHFKKYRFYFSRASLDIFSIIIVTKWTIYITDDKCFFQTFAIHLNEYAFPDIRISNLF